MEKEITPLEAVKKLRQNNIDDTHLFDDKLLDVIENALKENEYLKIELLGQTQELNIKNKALEIIRELSKFYHVEFCDKNQTMSFKIMLRDSFILETINIKNKGEYDVLKELFGL